MLDAKNVGLLSLGLLVTALGCSKSSDVNDYSKNDPAPGTIVEKVSLYQGIEHVLYAEDGNDGAGVNPTGVIADRDGDLRVHLRTAEGGVMPTEVAVVATFLDDDGDVLGVVSDEFSPIGDSKRNNLETTPMIPVPGEYVVDGGSISVEVKQIEGGSGPADQAQVAAQIDAAISDEVVIYIVPLRYTSDGSNRTPDISPEAIAEISDGFNDMYPATKVTIEVAPVEDYDQSLGSLDTYAWATALFRLSNRRVRDAPDLSSNTYYYYLFKPAQNEAAYCERGCLLGLSFVPESVEDTWAQVSMGVGFNTETLQTILHEVGHAHGREHAPCGLQGQPADPRYPYAGAELGSYGYSPTTNELFVPKDGVDIMSYCENWWISDFTYKGMLKKTQDLMAVDAQRGPVGPVRPLTAHLVDGDGVMHPMNELVATPPVACRASAGVTPATKSIRAGTLRLTTSKGASCTPSRAQSSPGGWTSAVPPLPPAHVGWKAGLG